MKSVIAEFCDNLIAHLTAKVNEVRLSLERVQADIDAIGPGLPAAGGSRNGAADPAPAPVAMPRAPGRRSRSSPAKGPALTGRRLSLARSQRLRAVIAKVIQPFSTEDVATALKAHAPDLAAYYNTTRLCQTLWTWQRSGEVNQISKRADGKPATYSRTAAFLAKGVHNPVETAYNEFRAGLKLPNTATNDEAD